jgi:hypothetical protein
MLHIQFFARPWHKIPAKHIFTFQYDFAHSMVDLEASQRGYFQRRATGHD